MKKALLLLLSALAVSASAFAQRVNFPTDKMTYGVQAGLNFQKGSGFFAGGFAQMPFLKDDLYLQGGVELALRRSGYEPIGKFSNLYLEVPLHLGYHYYISHEFSVFADAGPYIGLTLLRKSSGIPKSELSVFDAGLGINICVERMETFRIFTGYDMGLIPVAEHARNQGPHIGIGYRF